MMIDELRAERPSEAGASEEGVLSKTLSPNSSDTDYYNIFLVLTTDLRNVFNRF